MTTLANDITSHHAISWAAKLDGPANVLGGFLLLSSLLAGPIMFVVQSL